MTRHSFDYTVQTEGIDEKVINTIGKNILQGLTPVIRDGEGQIIKPLHDRDESVYTEDGIIRWVDLMGKMPITILYDMKKDQEINKLLVAGMYYAEKDYGTSAYELFLSDEEESAFSSENKVVSYDNSGIWKPKLPMTGSAQIFTFSDKPRGRYFGIKVLKSNPEDVVIRISRLSVYNTDNDLQWKFMKLFGKNLLGGLLPVITDDKKTSITLLQGKTDDLTDGIVFDTDGCAVFDVQTGAVHLVYNLKLAQCMDKLVFVGKKDGMAKVEVYLSNIGETLFLDENKITEQDVVHKTVLDIYWVQELSFPHRPKGRFIGLRLIPINSTQNFIQVDEIGLYSEECLICVERNNIINNDYTGNGVNLVPFNLMPADIAEGYNMAYWEMDAKRIIMMKPKIVRVWVQVDWMVTATNSEANYNNGIYDFNTAYMNALYIYFDAFKKAGTEIELAYSWKVGASIQSWFSFPDLSEPSCSAPKDLVKYAAAGSALLQELWSRSYDNVKYFTFGNEPNGSWDFECPGDQKAYYVQMVAAVDSKFKADGIRNQVQLWVCESADSWEWTKYMMDNAGEYLDANTYHTYEMSSDEITNLVKKAVSCNSSPFYITEFGEQETSNSTTMWNQGYAGYVINCANAGGSGVLDWTLHGVKNMTLSGGNSWEMRGYMHLWNSLLTDGLIPNGSYYIWSLMMRYIPSHSQVVKTTVQGGDVRATTFVTNDGNITVVAECNNTDFVRNLTIDFGNTNINKSFKKHIYSPTQVNYEMNALIPTEIDSFSCKDSFNDCTVDNEYSVVVYTTMDSQTQVAIDKVYSEISATSTLQLSAQVIDNTDGVIWSIAEGNGTISQNGLFTPAFNVAPGDMIAVRSTSISDSSAYGVALIKIT